MSRIIVTVPDSYIENLDQEAKEEHKSRSELIREAIRHHIEEKRVWEERKKRRERAFREMDRIRATTKGSDFDSTDFIRRWRHRLDKAQ